MNAGPVTDPKPIAAAGLAKSERCLLRGSAISAADAALRDVFDAASADEGAQAISRMGLAASTALAAHKAARIDVLTLALSRVQSDAVGSVSGMCRFAYDVLDAIDKHKPGKQAREAAVRGMLEAAADQAAAHSLREAEYARYSADLATVVPPVSALNMLGRVDVPEVGDVTRPAWFAAVAHSFAVGAEFEEGPEGIDRVLGVADPWVARRSAEDPADATQAHRAREQRFGQALDLSPQGRRALHLATLRVAGDDLPCAPETAPILAWRARQNRIPRADAPKLLEAALDEARRGTYPPGNAAGAWLRFMDAARALPGGQRLADTALDEMADGRGVFIDRLRWGVIEVLEEDSSQTTADALWKALRALDEASTSTGRADIRTARLGLTAAEWAEKGAEHLLRGAFDAVAAMPDDAPDRRIILDVARQTLSDPAADRAAVLREALERLTRMGSDAQQDFIVAASAPPPPAGTIRSEEEYVMIGSVRVPRRALKKD